MWLRDELLKSIWHAFTALDADHRGKVSKSQLKVLSYNLCTVMKIPHDPVALEEHFKDDDKGPLSNQGYMPYLNKFILDKVREDFDILEFNKICWTLCFHKSICPKRLRISEDDAFKVWCIFNFLSEDKYPLVIVTEEIEYFLQKLMEAMGSGWSEEKCAEYRLQMNSRTCLTAWELIELVGTGYFSTVSRPTLSLAINEVFQELILDVLKQGYMMKKGHKRKNWTERWFILRPNSMSYYVGEDLVEKKGDIILDQNCCVESLPDKDGKKCLFIIKCTDISFEISASDKKKKQEWIQAIQKCIQLRRLGLSSPHRESRLRRRELRQRQQVEEEDLVERMRELQAANDNKERQLEAMKAVLHYVRVCVCVLIQVRQQMEEQVAQKSSELEQYLLRVRELENMYHQLKEALEDERQAKQDEEAMRKLQARLLEEEAAKRAELEQMHLQQQRVLSQTEAERQEMVAEQLAKERALQAAQLQLERLEQERRGALEQYKVRAHMWIRQKRNSTLVQSADSEEQSTDSEEQTKQIITSTKICI
uniref:Switch-associated protein 70 n=1 Tax=Anabas testudineus TaxID=64144 RepID=A0A7N6AVI8_ANATE